MHCQPPLEQQSRMHVRASLIILGKVQHGEKNGSASALSHESQCRYWGNQATSLKIESARFVDNDGRLLQMRSQNLPIMMMRHLLRATTKTVD